MLIKCCIKQAAIDKAYNKIKKLICFVHKVVIKKSVEEN
jgi:hypothetical protein